MYHTSGTLKKTLFCKKFGASHVKFTHHPGAVIVASDPASDWDCALRYLSLHDDRYLRCFKGHRTRCVETDAHESGESLSILSCPLSPQNLSPFITNTFPCFSRAHAYAYACSVTSLELSPMHDTFLSAAAQCVRYWDLRTPMCVVGTAPHACPPSSVELTMTRAPAHLAVTNVPPSLFFLPLLGGARCGRGLRCAALPCAAL